MKTIIAVLGLATCCLCAEVPYSAGSKPQNGLLVLPLRQGPDNATNSSATPRNVTNENNDGLDDISAKLMERLRLQQGSERGVYHVYLEDGRLQRVQYTTAPISTQQSQQQQTNNYNQQQQTPDILSPESAGRRGVYFVQVPQERVQALQAKSQQNSQVSSSAQLNQEQANQVNVRYLPVQTSEAASQNQFAAPVFNAQLNQEQANQVNVRYLPLQTSEAASQNQFAAPVFNAQLNQEQANQVNVRYLPLQTPEAASQNQFAAPGFNAQYNQEQSSLPTVRYLPIQLGEDSSQYSQQQQQQEGTSGYVANVQYSQVEPIQGPVYSYSPRALTRVLRYAPVY